MDSVLNPDFFVAPSENLAMRSLTFRKEIGSVIEDIEEWIRSSWFAMPRVTYHEIPVMGNPLLRPPGRQNCSSDSCRRIAG